MRAFLPSNRRLLLSDFTLAGAVLTRDLHAASGKLVASRGEIVDLARLKEVASRADFILALCRVLIATLFS